LKSQLILMFSSIFLGACGQVLLKMGTNSIGDIDLRGQEFISTMLEIFTNVYVLIGICFFVTSMIMWIKVISDMELSRVYPSVSLSYVIVFIFSIFLFKEAVTASKIFGLCMVSFGVYFLNM